MRKLLKIRPRFAWPCCRPHRQAKEKLIVKITAPAVVDGTPVEIDVTGAEDLVGANAPAPSDVQASLDNTTDFRIDPVPNKTGSWILQRTGASQQAADGTEEVTATFTSAANPNIEAVVIQPYTPAAPTDLTATVTPLTPQQAQTLLTPSAGA